ncbi:MAG: GpE family phage tail protein [Asticcacaulis sp.]
MAAIYHWQPDYLYGLTLDELYAHQQRALRRYQLMNGIDED